MVISKAPQMPLMCSQGRGPMGQLGRGREAPVLTKGLVWIFTRCSGRGHR